MDEGRLTKRRNDQNNSLSDSRERRMSSQRRGNSYSQPYQDYSNAVYDYKRERRYNSNSLRDQEMEINRARRKSESSVQSANHLLNFSFVERPKELVSPNRRTFQAPYRKERFLQANYRFLVSKQGDYSENFSDPDLLVEWDAIEQVYSRTHIPYNCPICLDVPVVPKLSKCGHVFCWPCIIRYLSYNEKGYAKCPVCTEFINLKNLKSVMIDIVHQFTEGDTIQFTLMKRAKDSVISLPMQRWSARKELYPQDTDPDAIFSRFIIASDITPILQREFSELNRASKEALSCGEDSLAFILNAQDLLQERMDQHAKLLESEHSTQKSEADSLPVNSQSSTIVASNKVEDSEESSHSLGHEKKSVHKPEKSLPLKHETSTPDSTDHFFYTYQSSDGQLIFLHSLDVKVLLQEYGSYENFPLTLKGKILEIDSLTQTDTTRKRYKMLSHIPLSCDFQLVEIDVRSLVSKHTSRMFEEELYRRERKRNRREQLAQLERDQQNAPKFPLINYSQENFPAPETLSLMEEAELERAVQLSMSTSEESQQSEADHSATITRSAPISVPKGEWSQPFIRATEPSTAAQTSPSSPSFLDVVLQGSNSVSASSKKTEGKKKKKGKEYVLFSSGNSTRKRL